MQWLSSFVRRWTQALVSCLNAAKEELPIVNSIDEGVSYADFGEESSVLSREASNPFSASVVVCVEDRATPDLDLYSSQTIFLQVLGSIK